MPGVKRKRPSPPVSENEFDISTALTGGGGAFDSSDEADSDLDQAVSAASGKPVTNNKNKNKNPNKKEPGILDEDDSDSSDGDEAFIAAKQAASNRKSSNLKGRTVKRGGGFQAMGLNAALLKAITRKGFSVPTPIQRKTIPLVLEGGDVVGMARTGSGKTAAFVVPMIEKLKAHSAVVGARAIVMSPSRELALQTLKVVKELGRGTDLRCVLLVGGDSLEEQFSSMTSNPDIIIATPGRFHHLKVEMRLDLSSIQYVVFDEADRLFEMGFAVQLTEILHGLPMSRQTLLFSATLPKSLVEFARAGLQEPKLIRLDAESKVSPDLESAFFSVKSAEKEGALLQIIQDVIKIPTATDKEIYADQNVDPDKHMKKRRKPVNAGNTDSPTQYSTMVFAATKHHVEYLTALLKQAGYTVSYIYGSLDQTARKINVESFREGRSNILIVTDVAARGIDVPVLANVINYDFPSQPKVFVHRVGRTARAGKKGWSYNLVQDSDLPYLVDLQLFLSKRLIVGRNTTGPINYAEDVVIGTLPRDGLGTNVEWLAKLTDEQADLDALRSVSLKGEKLYLKTRNAASTQSVRRAKEIQAMPTLAETSPLFEESGSNVATAGDKEDLLARLRAFRPSETVFEIGKRGSTDDTIELLRKTRSKIDQRKAKETKRSEEILAAAPAEPAASITSDPDNDDSDEDVDVAMSAASDSDLEVTFSNTTTTKPRTSTDFASTEHFMSYTPRQTNLAEDRAYGVASGSSSNPRSAGAAAGTSFALAARDAAMDLTNDEGGRSFAESSRPRMRWDKAGRKYVSTANDEDGSKGARMVRGESGLKIAASLRSGRFDAWRKANAVGRMPRVGEAESGGAASRTSAGGAGSAARGNGKTAPRYKHKSDRAPKEADRFRDDYHVQKRRVAEAREKRVGKWKDGGGKSEIRSVQDIRRERAVKERKRAKNARPARRGRG